MLPSQESEYQEILQTIENRLLAEDIRPGEIYATDRPIGQYTSIRHPGRTYEAGINVSSYNPGNFDDPFTPLTTFNKQSTLPFYDSLRTELSEQIVILNASTSDGTSISNSNCHIKKEFATFLERKVNSFFEQNVSEQVKNSNTFRKEIIAELKCVDKKMINDKEWEAFAKNLALLCTGIGTIPAIASFISRAITGRYAIFDNKKKSEEEAILTTLDFKARLKQLKNMPITEVVEQDKSAAAIMSINHPSFSNS